MLADAPITATIAVKDLASAKEFYTNTLGLKPHGDSNVPDEAGVAYDCGGNTTMLLYQSSVASPAGGTACSWMVDDIESVVSGLQAKGVVFEDYDMPGLKTENGIATMGNDKSAWFKDPEGNILNVHQSAS